MISDKEIKQSLETAGVEFQYFTHARTNKQACTTCGSTDFDLISKGVESLVARAQEVKQLEFERDSDGDLVAHCSYGFYWIVGTDQSCISLSCNQVRIDGDFSSEQYAIEIAQDIHKAKILRELVHGGGE